MLSQPSDSKKNIEINAQNYNKIADELLKSANAEKDMYANRLYDVEDAITDHKSKTSSEKRDLSNELENFDARQKEHYTLLISTINSEVHKFAIRNALVQSLTRQRNDFKSQLTHENDLIRERAHAKLVAKQNQLDEALNSYPQYYKNLKDMLMGFDEKKPDFRNRYHNLLNKIDPKLATAFQKEVGLIKQEEVIDLKAEQERINKKLYENAAAPGKNPPAEVPAAASAASAAVDHKSGADPMAKLSKSTREYLTTYFKNKNIGKEVALTADQEKEFGDDERDPISSDVLTKPVTLNEVNYNLQTLLDIHKRTGKDPSTNIEFDLSEIQPARKIADKIDKKLTGILQKHDAAAIDQKILEDLLIKEKQKLAANPSGASGGGMFAGTANASSSASNNSAATPGKDHKAAPK